MSCGLVVCSECKREIHQERGGRWYHCEDGTDRCDGAIAHYAERYQVKGKACFRDDIAEP